MLRVKGGAPFTVPLHKVVAPGFPNSMIANNRQRGCPKRTTSSDYAFTVLRNSSRVMDFSQ